MEKRLCISFLCLSVLLTRATYFLAALFAFASFFAVLGLTLETWSIPLAFSAALPEDPGGNPQCPD
jgi:hypothetical protein